IDAFFALRGSGRPDVVREHLPRPSAPRALDTRTKLRFLRTVARDASLRDRVICHLACYAGLRVAEIVALDVADVRLSARKGSVRVRGKGRFGGKDRTVPLHAEVRSSVEAPLDDLGRPASGPPCACGRARAACGCAAGAGSGARTAPCHCTPRFALPSRHRWTISADPPRGR